MMSLTPKWVGATSVKREALIYSYNTGCRVPGAGCWVLCAVISRIPNETGQLYFSGLWSARALWR